MAKTYHVRVIRSFDHPRGHRRAGFEFSNDPVPQELELNKEQLAAIKSDPVLEILSDKEAAKVRKTVESHITDRQIGSTEEQQDPSKVAGEVDDGTTPQRGRRYASDASRAVSPEYDGSSSLLEQAAQTGDGNPPASTEELEGGSEAATSSDSLQSQTVPQLKAQAKELSVPNVNKLNRKADLIEAINNANTTASEG